MLTVLQIQAIERMLLSMVAGGIIGYERSAKGIDAGFRTHIIVCMSSCAIMLTNLYIFDLLHTGDPTRMPAQVISGVGFIGAGCILVTRHNRIKGVTTAAGVWAASCLGLCIGAGELVVGGVVLIIAFLTLTVFRAVDERLIKKTRWMRFYIVLDSVACLTGFLRYLQKMDIKVTDLEVIEDKVTPDIALVLYLHLKNPDYSEQIIADLEKAEGVQLVTDL